MAYLITQLIEDITQEVIPLKRQGQPNRKDEIPKNKICRFIMKRTLIRS